MSSLFLMVTITDRRSTDAFLQLYEQHGVDVNLRTVGSGTAVRETLATLGLEKTEKAVLLVLGEEHQRPSAADAAQRHRECNAGARHVDAHFAAQVFLQAGPGLGGDHGKEHGLFGLLQPQGGKGLLHRRACTHRAQADRDAVFLVKGQKGIGGVAVGDGDEPV